MSEATGPPKRCATKEWVGDALLRFQKAQKAQCATMGAFLDRHRFGASPQLRRRHFKPVAALPDCCDQAVGPELFFVRFRLGRVP